MIAILCRTAFDNRLAVGVSVFDRIGQQVLENTFQVSRYIIYLGAFAEIIFDLRICRFQYCFPAPK